MNKAPSHNVTKVTDRLQTTSFRIIAVVALTVPATLVQGHLLNRWDTRQQLQRSVAAIEQLPNEFGNWHLVSEGKPLSSFVCDTLSLAGHIHRIYEHAQSGHRVAVLLLVGPGGPLVRHPPEICYQSLDNRLLDTRTLRFTIAGQPQQFRLLHYRAESASTKDFYVAYAFGCQHRWDAPTMPRLAYGGEPALLKLQVLTDVTSVDDRKTPTKLVDFLEQLLPAVNRVTSLPTSQERVLAD